ncbi:hypothetical protein STEG23_033246 [Scotinomys teguina]
MTVMATQNGMVLVATQHSPQTPTQSQAVAETQGSTGHSGWHLWQHSPQIPTWPQVVAQTTGLYKALSVNRSHRYQLMLPQLLHGLGPRLALGNISGPDITLDSGGKQASHINLFLMTLTFSDMPLSPAQEPLHLSFPPLTLYSLTTIVSDCLEHRHQAALESYLHAAPTNHTFHELLTMLVSFSNKKLKRKQSHSPLWHHFDSGRT